MQANNKARKNKYEESMSKNTKSNNRNFFKYIKNRKPFS